MMSKQIRPYRLRALPNINISDDFDECLDKGEFDQCFGILKSDKSVSLTDMDNAIKQRGGQ